MYGKSNLETYIIMYKIDSQWKFAVWLRKLKGALYQPRGVGGGGRWEGVSRGRGYVRGDSKSTRLLVLAMALYTF